MATITFYGAAQEVTGSCHLVSSPAFGNILLDCGLHQGSRVRRHLDADNFEFSPQAIDCVVLSHAHLDHSGKLPQLVNQGFDGPIICTKATAELLPVMLLDSLGLYLNDLKRENVKRIRKGKSPLEPIYGRSDVVKVISLCQPLLYKQTHNLSDSATLTLFDAGHILGSAIIELQFTEKKHPKRLLFTGDLGKKGTLLMNDPTQLTQADLVLMEGTYGDRDHRTIDNTLGQFKEILANAYKKGGNVMLPAFAVGRTQELLLYLGKLQQSGELDNWTIFLDSPMAIEVTKIYDQWLPQLDCEGVKTLSTGEASLLRNFISKLHLCVTPDESMAINNIKNGAIIIAGSGMCTGGRISHHFKHRIWDSNNVLVFVGYQANGTLGRNIVDGAKRIKLFGEEFAVKAKVETLNGFSAHAGQSELIDWVAQIQNKPRVVLVHGESKALDCLSNKLWHDKKIEAEIPIHGQSIAF